MGYIYSAAESVIVVLQSASYAILTRNARSWEPYTEEDLRTLNEDRWIDSVWTYQELVNAKELWFTTTGLEAGISVSDEDLLNGIGLSLNRYKKKHEISAVELRQRFPFLDALEDRLTDRMIGGYLQRSVFACLTDIGSRRCDPEMPENRLYTLLRAITQEPS